MEGDGAAAATAAASTEKQGEAAASYTYWVREMTEEAAPLPLPKKLTPEDLSNQSNHTSTHLGSAWNKAGTWEEKSLNKWASDRIKGLLESIGSLDFANGKAEISELTKCTGDAFLVTVRNKKRVGYTYELTLNVKGEWTIGSENKAVKGYIDIEEFSLGELDDLQMQVRIIEDKELVHEEKQRVIQDMNQFLQPVQEKLKQFEQELKDR